MQTIYYSTPHFICHEGNLVDLNEFRRKRSPVQEGSLAPKLEEHLAQTPQRAYDHTSHEKTELALLPNAKVPRHSGHQEHTAWILDACASLGVVIMTISFAISFLL